MIFRRCQSQIGWQNCWLSAYLENHAYCLRWPIKDLLYSNVFFHSVFVTITSDISVNRALCMCRFLNQNIYKKTRNLTLIINCLSYLHVFSYISDFFFSFKFINKTVEVYQQVHQKIVKFFSTTMKRKRKCVTVKSSFFFCILHSIS